MGEVYSKVVIAATLVALVVLPLRGVPLLSTATQRGAMYRWAPSPPRAPALSASVP